MEIGRTRIDTRIAGAGPARSSVNLWVKSSVRQGPATLSNQTGNLEASLSHELQIFGTQRNRHANTTKP